LQIIRHLKGEGMATEQGNPAEWAEGVALEADVSYLGHLET
jgi:hypothetical protein